MGVLGALGSLVAAVSERVGAAVQALRKEDPDQRCVDVGEDFVTLGEFEAAIQSRITAVQCLADDIAAAHPDLMPRVAFALKSLGIPSSTAAEKVLALLQNRLRRLRRVQVKVTVDGGTSCVIDGVALAHISALLSRGAKALLDAGVEKKRAAGEEAEECCVCMATAPELVLPCAHGFCAQCVMQWSRFSVNAAPATFTCPLCRAVSQLTDDDSYALLDAPTPEEGVSAVRIEVLRALGCVHLERGWRQRSPSPSGDG